MLFNYFTIAFRRFRKYFFYTGFNLFGLSIAFTTTTLILIYIQHETSFENFHTRAKRIYRLSYHFQSTSGFDVHWARVPTNYVNLLTEEIPEIKQLIRFQNHEQKFVKIEEKKFKPKHVYVTDPGVFDVFSFHLTYGNPATALSRPKSVVITETLAKQYFQQASEALGKEIIITSDYQSENKLYKITGILKDLPSNTHLPVDMFISFNSPEERQGWAYIYTLLEENTDIQKLEEKFKAFVNQHSENQDQGTVTLVPQAIQDIHLSSHLAREITPNGNQLYVKLISFAGIFILLIALFNYINLNNALSLNRIKEIGMRSILGSSRNQMVLLGLLEAILFSVIACIIGLVLAYLTLPYFQNLLGIELALNPLNIISIVFLLSIASGILIGIYPAFLLTSSPPMVLLKRNTSLNFSRRRGTYIFKPLMMMIQIGASIMLVASTWVGQSQLQFLHQKQLGIAKEQILTFPSVPVQVRQNYQKLKERFQSLPNVLEVAACMQAPSQEIRDSGPVLIEGENSDPTQAPFMDAQIVSPEFVEMMEISLIAGENPFHNFTPIPEPTFTDTFTLQDYFQSRKLSYLINETAMKKLGWNDPQQALGKRINWSIGGFEMAYGPVAGIVKDFHQESLKHTIDPIIMFYEPIWLNTFLVKIHTTNVPQSIESMQTIWDELFPAYPFEFYFLDDLYNDLYKQERIQIQLLTYFSGLAVFLAFMGLFALVAYSLRTRLKEIALRKVLGANETELVSLFSKEYLIILGISALIAIPVSYIYTKKWLQIFAYQTQISASTFILALLFIGTILLSTIAFQTLKHINMNPAEVLKEE